MTIANRIAHTQWARLAACETLFAAAMLAGCGGGSGEVTPTAAAPATSPAASAPGPSQAPAPTPAPAPSPAPSDVPVALSTCGLSDFAAQALARINAMRASGANCGSSGQFAPAAALAWSARLTQAADGHSQDMAARNYFSHTSQDGTTFDQRITAAGYLFSAAGENIAAGQANVDAVMTAWATSPGHCANLMNPGFTEVGLSCVPGTSGATYRTYWTMDLARPR